MTGVGFLGNDTEIASAKARTILSKWSLSDLAPLTGVRRGFYLYVRISPNFNEGEATAKRKKIKKI